MPDTMSSALSTLSSLQYVPTWALVPNGTSLMTRAAAASSYTLALVRWPASDSRSGMGMSHI